MSDELFPFQKIGVKFLATKRHALLADEMGIGKTAQAICAATLIRAKRILVVCPATARINWQREFIKWGKIKASIVASDMARVGFFQPPIVICSYNYVTDFFYNLMFNMQWDLIIVDESHYLKEPTSARTKVVLGKEGLLHFTKRMWLLTGTPAPNHAGEIWTMLFSFGHTKLSYDGFVARYCTSYRGVRGHYAAVRITGSNTKHTPELKALLKKVSLRRLKKDVFPDMPPLFHTVHYLPDNKNINPFENLPKLKIKMELELAKLKERLDFDVNASDEKLLEILSLMGQSVSSLRRYHGLKKVGLVASLISEEITLGLYDKIVVFGIHTDVIESLAELLYKFKPVMITGKTPPNQRQNAIDNFQINPGTKIFLGNIQASGTSITLTASNQVGFIEQDWVPGNNDQAAQRCHRIGTTKPVTARHFCIADSFDERVTAIIARKTQELSTFI